MVSPRRAGTLFELVVVVALVGIVLGPALSAIGRQVQGTKWSRDRLCAVELANDVLEHLSALGYDWISTQLFGAGPVPDCAPTFASPVRYDGTVGINIAGTAPRAVNPVLGGPREGGNPAAPGRYLSAPDTLNEQTFRQKYRFNRRVEIFGGQNFRPPGFPPNEADCYLVRVTIFTDSQGSMATAQSQYQVVTVIGKR